MNEETSHGYIAWSWSAMDIKTQNIQQLFKFKIKIYRSSIVKMNSECEMDLKSQIAKYTNIAIETSLLPLGEMVWF